MSCDTALQNNDQLVQNLQDNSRRMTTLALLPYSKAEQSALLCSQEAVQPMLPAMQMHVTVMAAEDSLHTQCKLSLCVCSAAAALAKKLNVECPIIDGIFRVIHDNAEPLEVSPCMSSDVACCLAHTAAGAPSYCCYMSVHAPQARTCCNGW